MPSRREVLVAIALTVGVVACEKTSGTGQGAARPTKIAAVDAKVAAVDAATLETIAFYGITYTAPVGTNAANSGVTMPSHYPDPKTGHVVTIPTRIEPAITLIFPETNRYYVQIKKPPERASLADMIASKQQQKPQVSQVAGKPEADGWSLTYQWKSDDGSSVTMIHRRYAFPDSDYECEYDSGNTKDVAAAQRICASLRPKVATVP